MQNKITFVRPQVLNGANGSEPARSTRRSFLIDSPRGYTVCTTITFSRGTGDDARTERAGDELWALCRGGAQRARRAARRIRQECSVGKAEVKYEPTRINEEQIAPRLPRPGTRLKSRRSLHQEDRELAVKSDCGKHAGDRRTNQYRCGGAWLPLSKERHTHHGGRAK